jgi:transposase
MQSTTQASSPTLLPAQASHLPGFHPRPNPGLALHQRATRERRLAGATEALEPLHRRLAGARARLRGAAEIDRRVAEIPEHYRVGRYLKVQRVVREEHSFRQARRGRPGPGTAYRRVTRRRFDIEFSIDRDAVAYDQMSDGMYPLLTNDRHLTAVQVLEAHKGQPAIEKRFEQVKTVHEIAPVFRKNEGRIEALFTLYFFALLAQALIERELRGAMQREGLEQLPLYPEHRSCRRPTTEQVLRLFSLAQRHRLMHAGETVQVFDVQLTDLQRQILRLLGVSRTVYHAHS